MRRRLTLLTATAVAAVIAAACGVPDSGEFRSIGGDDVAELLVTTTTSTTTTLPTTTAPPTTLPPETTVTVLETTTTVPFETVDLYFVSGDTLAKVPYNFPPDPTPQQVLDVLADGVEPLGPQAAGLRSAIPSAARFDVSVRGGVVEVDMNEEALATVSADGPLEFGQIVMTLLTNIPGVGQVRFSVLGTPRPFVRGDGSEVPADTEVSKDDYASLLPPP